MKALKIGGIILLALVVIVLIMAAFAPSEVSVERSTVILAPRPAVFAHVQTFEKRDAWSPWMKLDPNMKLERIGQDGTVGAISKWEGNEDVGKGQEQFTLITPNERIENTITFLEPWESKSNGWMQLADEKEGTKVTWGMKSPMPFPMGIMALFMDMDGMIGKDFEKGLADLKAIVEKEAANAPTANYTINKVDLPVRYFIGVRKTIAMDQIKQEYMENLPKIYEAITKKAIKMEGMPCGMFYVWDEESKKTDLAIAIPVATKAEIAGFETFELPASSGLVIDYYGPYEGTGAAHMALDKYIKDNNLGYEAPAIEQYVTDPEQEPDPAKWLTKVIYHVK